MRLGRLQSSSMSNLYCRGLDGRENAWFKCQGKTIKKFIIFILVDNEDEGFNLIQPSLIQQLRTILDQYPDDGQILKVMTVIQTA